MSLIRSILVGLVTLMAAAQSQAAPPNVRPFTATEAGDWVEAHLEDIYKTGLASSESNARAQLTCDLLDLAIGCDHGVFDYPHIGKLLALKVVAAFRLLEKLDLVLVESGSMNHYDDRRGRVYWDRTGVMTRTDYEAIFSGGMGHNCVGSCSYLEDSIKTPIATDFDKLLRFADFGFEYSDLTHEWAPKYSEGSAEAAVIKATEDELRRIFLVNLLFMGGEEVRTFVNEQMKVIVSNTSTQDIPNKVRAVVETYLDQRQKAYQAYQRKRISDREDDMEE